MEEIQLTTWYGNYPIIYRLLYIPGDAGFLNHQQYHFIVQHTKARLTHRIRRA